MRKYELSISADYVPEWGTTEAIREYFQNFGFCLRVHTIKNVAAVSYDLRLHKLASLTNCLFFARCTHGFSPSYAHGFVLGSGSAFFSVYLR